MASLPVYFEQRLVGTISVDKYGPGFTYDPDWIGLRGAFPISTTMPLKSGAHCFRHFPALGSKPAARKRAAANSWATSRNGSERCNWSALSDRWRYGWCTIDWSTWQNCFSSLAAGREA